MPTVSQTSGPTHPRAILTIILVSYFMIVLDNSIIFTALPSIESAMSFTPTGLSWVQNAYTLVFGGLLLLGARSGDLLGRRRGLPGAVVVRRHDDRRLFLHPPSSCRASTGSTRSRPARLFSR